LFWFPGQDGDSGELPLERDVDAGSVHFSNILRAAFFVWYFLRSKIKSRFESLAWNTYTYIDIYVLIIYSHGYIFIWRKKRTFCPHFFIFEISERLKKRFRIKKYCTYVIDRRQKVEKVLWSNCQKCLVSERRVFFSNPPFFGTEKVAFWAVFLCLHFGFVIIGAKEYWRKRCS